MTHVGSMVCGYMCDIQEEAWALFYWLHIEKKKSIKHHCCSFSLPEPKFVGSFWVPESENPDDDKVFFFFRETAVEAQGLGKSTYSRIGQLCRVRNDFVNDFDEIMCKTVCWINSQPFCIELTSFPLWVWIFSIYSGVSRPFKTTQLVSPVGACKGLNKRKQMNKLKKHRAPPGKWTITS